MSEKEVVVGIDLGTTNSRVAIWDKDNAVVIPNDFGEKSTPSIVHFYDQNSYSVGLDAYKFLNSEPKSTIYSIKRIIGLNFNSKEVEIFKKDWPFKLIEKDSERIGIEIEINDAKFTVNPETISCYILKKLKSDVENFLQGKKVKKAVIAVPHYFNCNQKEATMKAGYLAGFEEVILINEPIAAAMAFCHYIIPEEDEKKLIIFDLGGGTLDVSLMSKKGKLIDVICVNGNTKLGGNDIDVILFEYIEKKIREMYKFKDLGNLNEIIEQQKERIKSKCELVKKNLSYQDRTVLNLPFFYKNEGVSIEITRQKLEKLCEDFLMIIRVILDTLFKDAKEKTKNNSYDKSQIDYIILLGGATKMPIIINFIEKYFGKKPISITSFSPDELVAIGAAFRGEIYFNNYLNCLFLSDVIPLNIGINVEERLDVIFKRNAYIDSNCKKKYRPKSDYQSAIEINIYEGIYGYAKENTLLGNYTLNIEHKKATKLYIEISFFIDKHLIFHVSAREIFEGKSKEIPIKIKNHLLTDKEIELEKKNIENTKLVNMNENEKRKLLIQKKELKAQQNSELIIKDNEQSLKDLKIIDLSLEIMDIYLNNPNNERYLNQIIELYESIINLISEQNRVKYIHDFYPLYKLKDNDNFLHKIFVIMNSLHSHIRYIDEGINSDIKIKKKEFECKFNIFTKYFEESKNISQDYFKKDYDDEHSNSILNTILTKYYEEKKANTLINFCIYILENYPPINFPMSIDEFTKKPRIKILVNSYSRSFRQQYDFLKNKEKIRVKIYEIVGEMFLNNIELESSRFEDENDDYY